MTGFTMTSHTPAVRIINYTDTVFISHQPDGKCRINTVNQHNILLAKHVEPGSIFMMLQGVSVLWWKGHHNLRARLYSASLLCSRTVCYFLHLRKRPALPILFTQAWSENWFFLSSGSPCTSLKLLSPPGRKHLLSKSLGLIAQQTKFSPPTLFYKIGRRVGWRY